MEELQSFSLLSLVGLLGAVESQLASPCQILAHVSKRKRIKNEDEASGKTKSLRKAALLAHDLSSILETLPRSDQRYGGSGNASGT